MKIRENYPISKLTTMRIGGNARYVIDVTSPNDLVQAYAFAREKNLPTFILGYGSNTIGRDAFDGVILLNKLCGIKTISDDADEVTIFAASGELLDDLVDYSTNKELTGIEAMTAIPGTVGGAVWQNSGAYGQDLSQVLTKVYAYDSKNDTNIEFSKEDLNFSYRQSLLGAEPNRYFVTGIEIKLHRGEIKGELYNSLQSYLDEHNLTDRKPSTIRRAITDIRLHKFSGIGPSAGSFFHNVVLSEQEAKDFSKEYPDAPLFDVNGQKVVASGWLIEQCGWRGKLSHGIRPSEKSALVLVNESAESYQDLAKAREEIRSAIKEKFGFNLEQEPGEI